MVDGKGRNDDECECGRYTENKPEVHGCGGIGSDDNYGEAKGDIEKALEKTSNIGAIEANKSRSKHMYSIAHYAIYVKPLSKDMQDVHIYGDK